MQNYMVVDLETTSTEAFKRKANPFIPENYVVAYGFLPQCYTSPVFYTHLFQNEDLEALLNTIELLVGHNIKFDLLYLWHFPALHTWLEKGGNIWDTQLAEYIISGQEKNLYNKESLKLISLATKTYGCPERPKKMEAYWEKNINTKDIPMQIVLEDLKGDVTDTHTIFLRQYEIAAKSQLLPLLTVEMNALLATTEMEFNGMFANTFKLSALCHQLEKELVEVQNQLQELAILWGKEKPINLNSPKDISLLFFGGYYKKIVKEHIGQYKNGKEKYKNKIQTFHKHGICNRAPSFYSRKTEKTGNYSVDVEVLEKIYQQEKGIAKDFSGLMLQSRNLTKQIGTYYKPLLNFIHPNGIIHHTLNHTVTETGRLSSSNPNQQNVPSTESSEIRKGFSSRYPEGVICEIDYSQIEVVVLAYLSQDENLILALEQGLDLHCRTLAESKQMPYEEVFRLCKVEKHPDWISARTAAKAATFAKQYGAGTKTIAKLSGLPESEVMILEKGYNNLYPKVTYFNEFVESTILNQRYIDVIMEAPSGKGNLIYYKSYYITPTQRKLTFKDRYSEKYEKVLSISKQEMMNYPIQSLAADILKIKLGELYRYFLSCPFYKAGKVKLINTIHDSILLDFETEQLCLDRIGEIKALLEDVKTSFKKIFDLNFNVPIKVEYKHGTTWYDC